MALPEQPAASVACACTQTGLYLAGRPADLLLALRRLTSSAAAAGRGSEHGPTLRQFLDALLPRA